MNQTNNSVHENINGNRGQRVFGFGREAIERVSNNYNIISNALGNMFLSIKLHINVTVSRNLTEDALRNCIPRLVGNENRNSVINAIDLAVNGDFTNIIDGSMEIHAGGAINKQCKFLIIVHRHNDDEIHQENNNNTRFDVVFAIIEKQVGSWKGVLTATGGGAIFGAATGLYLGFSPYGLFVTTSIFASLGSLAYRNLSQGVQSEQMAEAIVESQLIRRLIDGGLIQLDGNNLYYIGQT